MKEELQNLKNEAIAQIMDAKSEKDLESLRLAYLGRNGKVSKLIKNIKNIPSFEKKEVGMLINEIKNTINSLISEHKNKLVTKIPSTFDPTIPGIKPNLGHKHVISYAIDEISDIFTGIGFSRVRYPEVEWDWFAFGSLNFPDNHPARDEWETFFVDAKKHPKYGAMLLTPHTSSGQIREMKRVKSKPPVRMINISKCYRRQLDSSHYPMFHQFEGLVIDRDISIVNLKGTLDYFAQEFLGEGRITRIRPYHFQFTEPSFEVDVSCGVCNGKGCKICKSGWLEMGGAGIVHPKVLENGGIDPNEYSGFAFGWGVERVYMMKQGKNIPDLRILYSADLRFLEQF